MTVMKKLSLLKNMKSKKPLALIGSTLAALTLSAVVSAHQSDRGDGYHRFGGDPEQRQQMMEKHSERRMEKMKRYLELTDEQVAQLKTLFEEHKPEKAEVTSPKALHQAMQDLDPTASDYQKKVNELITSAQKQMAERMQARAAIRQQVYQLLTPEQRIKMELMEEMRHSMRDKGHKGKHGHHKEMRTMPRPDAETSES